MEAHALSDGHIAAVETTDNFGAASFSVTEECSFHARVTNRPTIYQLVGAGTGIGAGPYGYDYLVDKNWATIVAAGGGAEGQEFTTFHGHLFYVYSTVKAAVENAVSRFGAVGDYYVGIGIVPGDYTLDGTISWPQIAGADDIRGITLYGFGSDVRHSGGIEGSPGKVLLGSINLPTTPSHMHFENIYAASFSITHTSGETNLNARFIRSSIGSLTIDTETLIIDTCVIGSMKSASGVNPDEIRIGNSQITTDLDFSLGTRKSLLSLINNYFEGQIILAGYDEVIISGNNFSSGNEVIQIGPLSTLDTYEVSIVGNVFGALTSTHATITIEQTGSSGGHNITITGNSFAEPTGADADTCYLRLTGLAPDGQNDGPVSAVLFANNTLYAGQRDDKSIEQKGGFSVIGDYVRQCVFGPNVPPGRARYKITNSSGYNNLFIPDLSDETGSPDSGTIPIATPGSGTGLAPNDSQYLVLATDTDLSAERRFVPGAGLVSVDGGADGDYDISSYLGPIQTAAAKTIATGAVALDADQYHYTIDTESGDPSDDLDTLSGLEANRMYVLRPADGDNTVVIKHATDNILCVGNADLTLDDIHDWVWAFTPDGTTVYVLQGTGASGGSGHTIRENGTDQTARGALNIVDADAGTTLVQDDAGNNETELLLSLYALLSGRAGGQTIYGGTGASEQLVLKATSHATAGTIHTDDELVTQFLSFAGMEETIASGRISNSVDSFVIALAESGTADSISSFDHSAFADPVLFLRPKVGHTITVKHNDSGEGLANYRFSLIDAADVVLSDPSHFIFFIYDYDALIWVQLGGRCETVNDHVAAADPHTGYLLESLLDAKGDLIAASAADTPAKVTVGADDTILMADAAAAAGLKWVASATPSDQAIGDSAAVGTGDTFTRGDHKHGMPSFATLAAGLYSIVQYVNVPDAAKGATVTAGDGQGAIFHSGPGGFTAVTLYVDAEVAPGASGLPITWEYADTNDLDTASTWTTIATYTLSSEKSNKTTSMTNATVPADRLVRMNVGTIVGTPSDVMSTLEGKRALTT